MGQQFLPLHRAFFLRDAVTVARELLGMVLVHATEEGIAAGRIVETEAYRGPADAASHARTGIPTPRTRVMYGEGGYVYVYFIYGMYNCFNVVANSRDIPHAVLVRALEPVEGIGLMEARRGTVKRRNLCGGPGKLCLAMGITREHNGADLCEGNLMIARGTPLAGEEVTACKRINVDYAGEAAGYPYRFLEKESPYISRKPE